MLEPSFIPDPSGGTVIVTRFECPGMLTLVRLVALHRKVRRAVLRDAPGCVGAKAIVDWRSRTLLSVSLWEDADSLYGMGGVARHVEAARLPRVLGVRTASGVFCYSGDWRRVLFSTPAIARSPLRPVGEDVIEASDDRR
jgi:hypothetical protein